MEKPNELLEVFTKNTRKIENIIKYRHLYNIRNFAARLLIKSGIALDYALPFILASIIVANIYIQTGSLPFAQTDETKSMSYSNIEDGNQEKASENEVSSLEDMEYSTGWVVNDRGLYERIVTSYRINPEANLSSIDDILLMPKEEIRKVLITTNIKTIQKKSLTDEDSTYYSDTFVINRYFESEEDYNTNGNTMSKNDFMGLFALIFTVGTIFAGTSKIFIRPYIRDELKKYKRKFRPINKKELETLKNILKLRQENLERLTSCEEIKYPHRLRNSN